MRVDREGIFERLKHSIQVLGSPAEVQMKMMPNFVCKADELALDFDQWKTITLDNFSRELTEDQLTCLSTLDDRLTKLTRLGPRMWADSALRDSIEWQGVRVCALRALEAFAWPLEIPPGHADEYVGGS